MDRAHRYINRNTSTLVEFGILLEVQAHVYNKINCEIFQQNNLC